MINIAPLHLSAFQKAGISVYGVSLILMFLTSTLYHAVSREDAKQILRRLDHCAIYLLIAGTFTPLLTITIDTPMAKAVLGFVWCMAILGLIFKAFYTGRFERLSVAVYLLMGWSSLVVVYQLYNALEMTGFVLLLAGGLFYSVGVIFYVKKHIPYSHAIWHCFVFAGAMCHCWLIVEHVLSAGQIL